MQQSVLVRLRSSNRWVAFLNLATELVFLTVLVFFWRWFVLSGLVESTDGLTNLLGVIAFLTTASFWWWAGNLSTSLYKLVGTWVPDPLAVLGPVRSAPIFIWRIICDLSESDGWYPLRR